MAGFKSTYLCNLYLNALDSNASFDGAIPSTLYLQPYTVAPTAAGGGTQWTDSGISRAAWARNTTTCPFSTAAEHASAIAFSFGTPVAGATIVGYGRFDASGGGNLLDYYQLETPKVATAGQEFIMPVGGFTTTEA
jgi:hypothetical protein